MRITRPDLDDGRTSYISPIEAFSLSDELDGAEIGEKVQLEYCEMTQEEIDQLPEFEGW